MAELTLVPLDNCLPSTPITLKKFPAIIGRHPECELQILHPLLSRRHVRFYTKKGDVWMQDLESLNGTTLNGQAVTLPSPIKTGDEIALPCHRFRAEVSRCGCGLADSSC